MSNEAVQDIFKELAKMVEKKVFEDVSPQVKQGDQIISIFEWEPQLTTSKFWWNLRQAEVKIDTWMSYERSWPDIVWRQKVFYGFDSFCDDYSDHCRVQRLVKTIDITGAYPNAGISKQKYMFSSNNYSLYRLSNHRMIKSSDQMSQSLWF